LNWLRRFSLHLQRASTSMQASVQGSTSDELCKVRPMIRSDCRLMRFKSSNLRLCRRLVNNIDGNLAQQGSTIFVSPVLQVGSIEQEGFGR
jgi:hypothetical protein